MKKSILAVLSALLVLSGCQVLKKKDFKDLSTQTEQIERKKTSRPSDTVTVERQYNVKYKDTTIYTTSYDSKTIIRETYDNEGNQRIDCIPEEIREEIENINRKLDKDIQSQTETEHKFDIAPMLWAIGGIGGIMLIMIVVIAYVMISFKKTISETLTKVIK